MSVPKIRRTFPKSVQPGIPKLSDVPSGYKQYCFGDLFEVVQRPLRLEDATEYDLVTVKRSRGGIERRATMVGAKIAVKSQFYLAEDDFLISKRQIVHGACGIVSNEYEGSIVSNEYSVLRCKSELDLQFLRYLTNTIYFQQTCFHSSIGVHIEKMIFKLDEWFKWRINLPSLPEQKKIAAFLGVVDEKLAALGARKAGLETYKRGLMQKLFSRTLRFTKPDGTAFPDWEEMPLKNVADPAKRNSFIDGDWIESPYITDNGVRLIQTGNVGVGTFKDKNKRYISDESFTELKCKEVEVGDLLVCRLADPAGRACVMPDVGETKMLTSVDVTIIKVDPSVTSAYFIAEYFSLPKTLHEVATLCGGSTRTRIARSNLAAMKVPLPHPDEQRLIADALQAMDAKIRTVTDQITRMESFKKGLLQQMFV